MERKEILNFKDITFVREGRKILSGVNWVIKEKEVWALLGLNGTGKSTLLSMIPAYTFPTKGDYWVFGNKFGNYAWPKIRKKLGFVSSNLKIFSGTLNNQKVEKVILSGKYNTIGIYDEINQNDIEKGKELLKDFNLEHLKDKKYEVLSQGEQRKVLLARAFMTNPELLILDEPCSGLDLKSREYYLKTLGEKIKEKEISIIYVTHQLEELIPEITHVAILGNDGKMLVTGKKEEVLTEENLFKLYGVKVKVIWEENRPWLIVKN